MPLRCYVGRKPEALADGPEVVGYFPVDIEGRTEQWFGIREAKGIFIHVLDMTDPMMAERLVNALIIEGVQARIGPGARPSVCRSGEVELGEKVPAPSGAEEHTIVLKRDGRSEVGIYVELDKRVGIRSSDPWERAASRAGIV